MDKRITGLIRHFNGDGLASPSYVPETPLPRDPGKSASLPLAEALSIVEPGATATVCQNFRNFIEKKYKTRISVNSNILCQICSNRHTAEIMVYDQNTWILLNLL